MTKKKEKNNPNITSIRVRGDDLESATMILNQNNKNNPFIQDNQILSVYTIAKHSSNVDENGNYLIDDENSDMAYAKEIRGNRNRFYVKFGEGHLFDPFGMFTTSKDANKLDKAKKKPIYSYKEVSPRIFKLYLNFLKTKNKAWLINAEREIING